VISAWSTDLAGSCSRAATIETIEAVDSNHPETGEPQADHRIHDDLLPSLQRRSIGRPVSIGRAGVKPSTLASV